MPSQTVSQHSQTLPVLQEWLHPLLQQGQARSSQALNALSRGLQNFNPADFNRTQQQAFDLATQRAMGGGGFIPQAQNTFMQAAQGQGLNSFVPQSALNQLGGMGGLGFLPQFTRNTLTQGAQIPGQATNAFSSAINANSIPGAAQSALTNVAGGQTGYSPQDIQALQQTANGDFLMGGQGFDSAVQAAVRAAQPGILSTFGSGGVGAGTGGLAQAAIGQAGVDAFARQFGQERQNQLGASNTLAGLGLQQQQQQLGAAGQLAGLGLAQQDQRLGAAGQLANLGLAQNQQNIGAAGLLGDFASGAQGRALQGSGILADLSNSERARQLQAAGQLPGLAFSGLDQLLNVGNLQQQQAQREIEGPINADMQLFQAAMGIPGSLSSLFGSDTQGTQTQNAKSNIFGNVLGGLSLFGGLGGLSGLGSLFGMGGGGGGGFQEWYG